MFEKYMDKKKVSDEKYDFRAAQKYFKRDQI